MMPNSTQRRDFPLRAARKLRPFPCDILPNQLYITIIREGGGPSKGKILGKSPKCCRLWRPTYLTARPGEAYLLFFPDGGAVSLDLTGHPGRYELRWVDPGTGEWAAREQLAGGGRVPIRAPGRGNWAAAIVRTDR